MGFRIPTMLLDHPRGNGLKQKLLALESVMWGFFNIFIPGYVFMKGREKHPLVAFHM